MGACERVWCTGESKSMSSFPFTWTAEVKGKSGTALLLPTIAEVKVRSKVALPAPGWKHATLRKPVYKTAERVRSYVYKPRSMYNSTTCSRQE